MLTEEVAARVLAHPAMALRAGHARLTGRIPSLIVTGGDTHSRAQVAFAYVRALTRTGALSRRKAERVQTVREEDLPDYRSGLLADLAGCPLLVLAEVGAVVREDTPGSFVSGDLGHAPLAVAELLHARGEHLPTIVTTLLPVGNPPLTGDDLDAGYGNYALFKALQERGRAGWPVPSLVAGFDPDARIVDAGVATLRGHLGEASWWRLCLTSLATAVDAGDLHQPGLAD